MYVFTLIGAEIAENRIIDTHICVPILTILFVPLS